MAALTQKTWPYSFFNVGPTSITTRRVTMEHIFEMINNVFSFVIPVSDFFWDFPTNFDWYAKIPILGNFSLAVILLVGSGIFFTIRLGFIQVTHFKEGIMATIVPWSLLAA